MDALQYMFFIYKQPQVAEWLLLWFKWNKIQKKTIKKIKQVIFKKHSLQKNSVKAVSSQTFMKVILVMKSLFRFDMPFLEFMHI